MELYFTRDQGITGEERIRKRRVGVVFWAIFQVWESYSYDWKKSPGWVACIFMIINDLYAGMGVGYF